MKLDRWRMVEAWRCLSGFEPRLDCLRFAGAPHHCGDPGRDLFDNSTIFDPFSLTQQWEGRER